MPSSKPPKWYSLSPTEKNAVLEELKDLNDQLEALLAQAENTPPPKTPVVDLELHKKLKYVEDKVNAAIKKLDPANAG